MTSNTLLRASGFCRPLLAPQSKSSPGSPQLAVRLEILAVSVATETKAAVRDDGVVYLSSAAALRQAAVVVGSVVVLQYQQRQMAVTLQLQVKEAQHPQDEMPVLSLSALAATNLGVSIETSRGNGITAEKRVLVGTLSPYYGQGIPPPPAAKVTLQCWRRPLRRIALGQQQQQSQPLEFSGDAAAWPFPANGSILQVGALIRACNRNSATLQQQQPFCYQVLEVVSDTDNGVHRPNNNTVTAYRVTPSTRFRLETALPGPTSPQLPPCATLSTAPPHPDRAALLQALQAIPSSATTDNIVHVIGTDDDHDASALMETVAALTGRTYLSVTGLAATAYLRYSVAVSSGSTADKLAGLEACLKEAVANAPSLLYISELQDEFASTAGDALMHLDQEERFWSLFMDELSSFFNTAPLYHQQQNHLKLDQIPSVLVVLSSSQPLSPGPLLQNLVGPSLNLSYPDRPYTDYLLSLSLLHETKSQILSVIDSERSHEVHDLLHGRSAREIRMLLAEWVCALSSKDDNSVNDSVDDDDDKMAVLTRMCDEHDATRRESGQARIIPVHWQDVGGLAHVRREILDTIELPLKYPHLFSASGRSGVLLYGPPGTGKTLVAKAVATECGLPFISVKGPELLGAYVGESEAQVRAVFDQARERALKNTPAACILFFDELDSLAPRRGDQASGGNVMDRVVATLFAELDKSEEGCSVICMGATNRPDLLDPALLRPGRLDRLVYLGVSADDRTRILATQIRKLRLEENPDQMAAAVVEQLPTNLTGADLSTIATGGLLRATERLCREADDEIEEMRRQGLPQASVDDVLASWEEDRLEPVVTLEDLIEASKAIVPSVSAAELKKYEALRDQFCNTAVP